MSEMVEILGGNGIEHAFADLEIKANRTYRGTSKDGFSAYEVWQMKPESLKKLCAIDEDDWKGGWGWFRSATGSNLTFEIADFTIAGKPIKAWFDDEKLEDIKNWYAEDGEEFTDSDLHDLRTYADLLSYFCDEIGATLPKNICALATHLAQINEITMGELFSIYQQ